MRIADHDIAVCSWSLQPINMSDLVDQVRELTLSHVQLALGPLLQMPEPARQRELEILRDSELQVTAGMIGFAGEDYSSIAQIALTGGYVPETSWPERRRVTLAAAELLSQMGVAKLTTHVGFIPTSNDAKYQTILARVRELADALHPLGVSLGMETGQEPAADLLRFLNDLNCRNVFINFDPANMLLYGCGDPIEAIQILGRHIDHAHVKDATLSDQPGRIWGTEKPFGSGAVDAEAFLAALQDVGYEGPLAIERESGLDRQEDVAQAIVILQDLEMGSE